LRLILRSDRLIGPSFSPRALAGSASARSLKCARAGGAHWQSVTLLCSEAEGFGHLKRGITFVNRGFCDGGHIAGWSVLAKQTWGVSCYASVPGFIEFTARNRQILSLGRESEHAPRRIQRYCRRGSHDRARVDALACFRVLAAKALTGPPTGRPSFVMASEETYVAHAVPERGVKPFDSRDEMTKGGSGCSAAIAAPRPWDRTTACRAH
jgi:hypothetical protein